MTENETQGITRRDLLKRGAVLGGAVVWATPVVQTLGMGRAYANTASPVGKDISYIGINVTDCAVGDAGDFFAKWEDGDWEDKPGAAPECADKEDLAPGVESGGKGFRCLLVRWGSVPISSYLLEYQELHRGSVGQRRIEPVDGRAMQDLHQRRPCSVHGTRCAPPHHRLDRGFSAAAIVPPV
jgi:hypothetical protein